MAKEFKIVEAPIDGTEINFGGTKLIVPPLTFGWVKRNMDKLKEAMKLVTASPFEQAGALPLMCEIVTAAIKRNYNEITEADVEDLLDFRNMEAAFLAATGQSDVTVLTAVTAGETKPTPTAQ